MADIAPALAQKLAKDFRTALEDSAQLARIAQLVAEGGGSYAAAGDFAWEAGTLLAAVFAQITGDMLPDGRMPPELAEQAIRPLLEADHQLIADLARQVQDNLNQAAGIGLKAQAAPLNTDRVNGIIAKICAAESFDKAAWVLGDPVRTFSQSVVDDTLERNARFQYDAGLSPKVVRKAEAKACKWCRGLEGTYEYPKVPADVYRRHENCRCVVEYDPGGAKKFQNVHTKRWKTAEFYNTQVPYNVQEYKSTRIGETLTFKTKGTTIQAHAIDGYDRVYVSDDASIKPKALHNIHLRTVNSMKIWSIPTGAKPAVVILSDRELPTAYGRYDAITNTVYYIPQIGDVKTAEMSGGLGYTELHEMWHAKQAEDFRKSGWVITSENYSQYLTALRKKAQSRIEKLGITEYNVMEISEYAYISFLRGFFDEVEAEWHTQKIMKGGHPKHEKIYT